MDDQLPDTGDAPPRPPKTTSTTDTTRNAPRDVSPSTAWFPTTSSNHHHHRHQPNLPSPQSSQMACPSPPPKLTPKPRLASSGTVRVKSASGGRPGKALISDTELLYLSIKEIENGLADGSLVRQFEVGVVLQVPRRVLIFLVFQYLQLITSEFNHCLYRG